KELAERRSTEEDIRRDLDKTIFGPKHDALGLDLTGVILDIGHLEREIGERERELEDLGGVDTGVVPPCMTLSGPEGPQAEGVMSPEDPKPSASPFDALLAGNISAGPGSFQFYKRSPLGYASPAIVPAGLTPPAPGRLWSVWTSGSLNGVGRDGGADSDGFG